MAEGKYRDQWRNLPRWARTTVIGYLVVAVFAAGYYAARGFGSGSDTSRIVGLLAAAPLALAFIWDRLVSLKAFGIEVELAEVRVYVETSLTLELTTPQYFSGKEEMLKRVGEAVRNPKLQLLEINLRSAPYWWSTRLYLQAALLRDYSRVKRMIFVEDDQRRRYVGMASPRDVCSVLGGRYPNVALIYQDSRAKGSSVEDLIQGWPGLFVPQAETVVRQLLTSHDLAEMLGPRLETAQVDHDGPEGPLLHFRILDRGVRFVPIVNDGRLVSVIDARKFARRRSLAALRRELGQR